MTLRNMGYYIFNALATIDMSPFLRLKPKEFQDECFLLLYLKQKKQEIRKRIQAKILGVYIAYEQEFLRVGGELCALLFGVLCSSKHVLWNFWHSVTWENPKNVRPIRGIFRGFYYFFSPISHSVRNVVLYIRFWLRLEKLTG